MTSIKKENSHNNLFNKQKIAIISHVLPPSPSGQAVALYRLLQKWEPDSYILFSRLDYTATINKQKKSLKLRGKYIKLREESYIKGSSRYSLLFLIRIIVQVVIRVRQITKIAYQENCGAVLSCSGDLIDLPVGYIVSKKLKVPFYAYIFDYYSNQWIKGIHRFFAHCIEPAVLKGAAGVIVTNEFLSSEYKKNIR